MSNIKILFGGSEKSGTDQHVLEVYVNKLNEICITIKLDSFKKEGFISLDKQSAIRFSKEIRRQIALLEE